MTAAAPSAAGAARQALAAFVCPHCRGPLPDRADGARCGACGREYRRHHGLLDLRVFPDPYLDLEEDLARAQSVAAVLDRLSLPELLAHYWSLSTGTPPSMRPGFVRSALRAPARARRILEVMERDGLALSGGRILEIGSGTGGFLVEAAARGAEVTGLDIAMRWLQVSRRRFRDAGPPDPDLVCACAERLPFDDGRFDAVAVLGTLEFVRDLDAVLAECARVLRPGGRAYLTAVNRYSLGPEPHVGLWGVGWLPRRWQKGYVRRRGRGDFANVRLFSFAEVAASAARHFARCRIEPAAIPEELRRDLALHARLGAAAYAALRTTPGGRGVLRRLAPEWEIVLTRAG